MSLAQANIFPPAPRFRTRRPQNHASRLLQTGIAPGVMASSASPAAENRARARHRIRVSKRITTVSGCVGGYIWSPVAFCFSFWSLRLLAVRQWASKTWHCRHPHFRNILLLSIMSLKPRRLPLFLSRLKSRRGSALMAHGHHWVFSPVEAQGKIRRIWFVPTILNSLFSDQRCRN